MSSDLHIKAFGDSEQFATSINNIANISFLSKVQNAGAGVQYDCVKHLFSFCLYRRFWGSIAKTEQAEIL
jgi:hypothetical protein